MLYRTSMRGLALALGASVAFGACKKNQEAAGTGESAATGTAPGMTGAPAGSTATAAPAPATANVSDANIFSIMGVINGGEVSSGQMAERKARNSQVKAFGQQMVREHKALQAKFDALAKKANITPQANDQANQLQDDHKKLADSLSKLSGAQFDSAYINSEVQDHQKALDAVKQLQNSAQNAELKTLLGQSVDNFQAHLTKAQSVQQKLGAKTTASR